jgi:hypothetical protein
VTFPTVGATGATINGFYITTGATVCVAQANFDDGDGRARDERRDQGEPLPVVGGCVDVVEGMLLPKVAGGAGFASYDQIITALTTNAKGQHLNFAKAAGTSSRTPPRRCGATRGSLPLACSGRR